MKKLIATIAVSLILATSIHAKGTSQLPPPYIQTIDTANLHIACAPLYTNIGRTCVPGRIPTFAFVGTISAIGTYTLYGAGAGIVTCGLIYICTNGNRRHTKHAIWGCVAGMAVGGFVKWLSVR